jgi:hypothetical protein
MLCLLLFHQIVTLFDNIVGCVLSAPDSSSPRGYSRIFSGIDLKNEFSSLIPLYHFLQFFVDFLGHQQYADISYQNVFPTNVHHCHSLYFPLLEFS